MSDPISPRNPPPLTRAFHDLRMGRKDGEAALFQAVYGELRSLAAGLMRRERIDHTLQTTALVHEAYVRLMGGEQPTWENRAHFFGAAGRAMRQILVDHARRVGSVKRGGGAKRSDLADLPVPLTTASEDLLAVNDALAALESVDERKARLVELRFFAGLGLEQIAELLAVSERTVKRDWSFARAWLARYLRHGGKRIKG